MNDSQTVTLTAVGDLMFHGPLAERMAAGGDLLWGFRPLGDALQQGDLLFGNFETPISVACQPAPGAPDKYFSPPGVAKALREYGFSVVNLAHNHIYDFGAEGVEATISEMDGAGLPHIGIGRSADEAARPVIVTSRNGVPVGFIGYTTASNALNPKNAYVACFPALERVARDVAALRRQVKTVVVSCHTGAQHNPYPAPETRQLARVAIEAGAAVFLGHHPHVPQGRERIGKGLAVYSLGDFVAPAAEESRRWRFMAQIRLSEGEVVEHAVTPCCTNDAGQTIVATGEMRNRIATHIDELGRSISAGRSDELHFETARGRFISQYVRSWVDEFRIGGPKVIIRKLCHLRAYHVHLIWRILVGKLRSIQPPRSEQDHEAS